MTCPICGQDTGLGHDAAKCVAAGEAVVAERDRLWEAANWLLICQRNYERKVPVRGLYEAWEGLRVAVAASDKSEDADEPR